MSTRLGKFRNKFRRPLSPMARQCEQMVSTFDQIDDDNDTRTVESGTRRAGKERSERQTWADMWVGPIGWVSQQYAKKKTGPVGVSKLGREKKGFAGELRVLRHPKKGFSPRGGGVGAIRQIQHPKKGRNRGRIENISRPVPGRLSITGYNVNVYGK